MIRAQESSGQLASAAASYPLRACLKTRSWEGERPREP